MPVTRREFLKTIAAGPAALAAVPAASNSPLLADLAGPGAARTGQTTPTICPFCGCGCGFLVTVENGQVTNIEGDPAHPINRGAACSKGSAIAQIREGEQRVDSVVSYISQALSEQTSVTNDYASQVEKVAGITEVNSAAAAKLASEAETLQDLANAMQTVVGRFKIQG